MRRYLILIAAFSLLLFSVAGTSAQAETTPPTNNHTARAALTEGEPRLDHTRWEEAEGKEIWEKLQAKQFECKNLTDDNYGSLGEYFMGQMLAPSGVEGMGSSHEMMNNMMTRMMGEEGEKQMHVTMGKRLSGCDTSAQFPQSGVGFMPLMFLLRQGFGGQGMMGGWNGFNVFGWVLMILFWILLVLGAVVLIRYLTKIGGSRKEKSPLEILKERYAKGEIDKKEFEEKKKDLT